jgi:hypothetical protein
LGVYEEEYNEYKHKNKTYSIIGIRPEFKYIIEDFFIFPLKSKQTDQIDIALKKNLELSVVRNRDLLIGVIIPAFERNKQIPERILRLPIVSCKEQIIRPVRDLNSTELAKDPRLNKISRKNTLELNNQIINNKNLAIVNEKDSIYRQNVNDINNLDRDIEMIELIKPEPKEINSNNIPVEMMIPVNCINVKKEDKINQNNDKQALNDSIDNYSFVSSDEELEKLDKKINIKSGVIVIWSGYMMTDKNHRIHSMLSLLNENSKYNEYLNSLLREEKNIYIDKSPISEANDIFDFLTSLDRESIQFIKIESNESTFNEFYDDLSKRNKNLVRLKISKNSSHISHSVYLFAFNYTNQFDRLASGYSIKSIGPDEKCLIGVIVYSLSDNSDNKITNKRKSSDESDLSKKKHFKSNVTFEKEENDHNILIVKNTKSYNRSVSVAGIDNYNRHKLKYSNSIDNGYTDNSYYSHRLLPAFNNPTFKRTFPFDKINNYSSDSYNTKVLIFSGIFTTNYNDEKKFIDDVLDAMECSDVKVVKIENMNNRYGQLKVTLENAIVGARILSRKKRYLKQHSKFNRVFIDAEKIRL